jgi:cytochrome P450
MLHAGIDGRRALTRDEIVANVRLMLTGGNQEPRDLVLLAIWALCSHPEQLAEVRADPSLVRAAIEETARCYSPVGTSTRQTTRRAELAGVELEQGALVAAVLSSANRDERHWTDPDRFDIHRKEGAHLAFSTGAHFCLGAWLARVEVRTAVRILLERLPGLRLDPEHEVVIRGFEFRGPEALHVRWDS